MSSMRNAVQRRNHRERAQPQEREKWGLLEKHKDYSKRARDFNEKKAKLRTLRQKVLEKNPDEFYFGMMSKKGPASAATGGKDRTGTLNGNRGNKVLSQDAVKLFKTQDLGYVRTMRNKARKEVETLRRQVVGIRGEGERVVFCDSVEEQVERVGDENEDEDEMEEEDEQSMQESLEAKNLRKLQQREAEKLQARLDIAEERLKALTDAEEALDLQRAKMAKSPSVGGVNNQGVKFKVRERKR